MTTKTFSTPSNVRRAVKTFVEKNPGFALENFALHGDKDSLYIGSFVCTTEDEAAVVRAAGFVAELVEPETPAPAPKGTRYIREASDHGGVCAEVWGVADSMPGAKRKEVIEACRKRGIAFGTARTQYQKWLAAKKVRGGGKAPSFPLDPDQVLG